MFYSQERADILERYSNVVSASADFMADFARGGRIGNETSGYHFELGPPIMNSAEHGDQLQLPKGCGAQDNPCKYLELQDNRHFSIQSHHISGVILHSSCIFNRN